MSGNHPVKPITLSKSLLYFGIPSLIAVLFIYRLWPYLIESGLHAISCFLIVMYIPMILMLMASLVGYYLEGKKFSWFELKERFRLVKMGKREWIWTIGLILLSFGIQLGLGFTAEWLSDFPIFSPPDHLPPVVDPRIEKTMIPTEFFGVLLKGNWWIVGLYLIGLFFNIVGEEFWWRGYILPRQELAMGKYTWLVHGLLWTMFHIFWKWNLLILLPGCLLTSFVAYKLKNTWPAIISHFVINSLGMIPLILGVSGINM